MANHPEYLVGTDWTNLALELTLTDGETYLVQVIDGSIVEYTDALADPTGTNTSKNFADIGQWIEFEADSSEPTWFRARQHKARIAVKDK